MEAVVPIVLLSALSGKILDFVKYVRAKDWNASVTQAAAWATGILLTFGASAADIFENTVIPGVDQTFADLNGWSKVLVGAGLSAILSKVVDLQKAFDNTQSAATPSLLPPKS